MAESFETSFPNVGPGTSAFITWTEPGECFGNIASTSTSTPIPPTKCVKLLQKRFERLITLKSVIMLDPVVVNPLTVSKKASTKEGISPVITNGNAPNADINIHDNATITKPSLPCIDIFLGFLRESPRPIVINNIITPK